MQLHAWTPPNPPEKLSEPERLRREADELDRQAEHLKHSSWMGEPPWLGAQQDAADKRLLATLLERTLTNKKA